MPRSCAATVEFFRGSRFEYTLQPPLLGENSVDESCSTRSRDFASTSLELRVLMRRRRGACPRG